MKFINRLTILLIVSAFAVFPALAQEDGGVKGKVRNTRGGVLAGVKVTAIQSDQDVKSAVTNKSGDFYIAGLKSGRYNFSFSKAGYSTGSLNNVEVKKNKIRDLGGRLVLDVDEGTLVFVKGSVFSEEGWSIFGAKVDIAIVESNGSLTPAGNTVSGEAGEFTFRFPNKPTTYRVTATYRNVSAYRDVTVDSAAIYRLAITLKLEKEKDDN